MRDASGARHEAERSDSEVQLQGESTLNDVRLRENSRRRNPQTTQLSRLQDRRTEVWLPQSCAHGQQPAIAGSEPITSTFALRARSPKRGEAVVNDLS